MGDQLKAQQYLRAVDVPLSTERTWLFSIPVASPKAKVVEVGTRKDVNIAQGVIWVRDRGELEVEHDLGGVIRYRGGAEAHVVIVNGSRSRAVPLPESCGSLLGTFTSSGDLFFVFAYHDRRQLSPSPAAGSGGSTDARSPATSGGNQGPPQAGARSPSQSAGAARAR